MGSCVFFPLPCHHIILPPVHHFSHSSCGFPSSSSSSWCSSSSSTSLSQPSTLSLILPLLSFPPFSASLSPHRFSAAFHALGHFSPFVIIAMFILPLLCCPHSSSSSTLLLCSTHCCWALAITGFASLQCPVIVVPVIALVATIIIISLLSL